MAQWWLIPACRCVGKEAGRAGGSPRQPVGSRRARVVVRHGSFDGSIRAAAFMPRGRTPHEWGGPGRGTAPVTPRIMRVEALKEIRQKNKDDGDDGSVGERAGEERFNSGHAKPPWLNRRILSWCCVNAQLAGRIHARPPRLRLKIHLPLRGEVARGVIHAYSTLTPSLLPAREGGVRTEPVLHGNGTL